MDRGRKCDLRELPHQSLRSTFFALILLCNLCILLDPHFGWAAFSNYNSILIGDRAAGMGGAFTALTNDPGGCSFYNPAALALMHGRSLSAAINVYHKYEIDYGVDQDFSSAPFRVNRGAFKSIPAASGSIASLGHFAFGISILVPDYEYFAGEIFADGTNTSYLNLIDESLWVGGTLALNLTAEDSVGLTMYYTSRNLVRTLNDLSFGPSAGDMYVEEKTFHNNSILYILGYHRRIAPRWTMGVSYRFPSLEVSGSGSYYSAQIKTDPYTKAVLSETGIDSETRIPARAAIGIAYEIPKAWTLSMDLSHYAPENYTDIDLIQAGENIVHNEVWNGALGFEYHLYDWLRMRLGIYTNFSSTPKIDHNKEERQGDHVDMWGFSANLAIFTSDAVSVTLGGYYTGGRGESTQHLNQAIRVLPKSFQTFAFLVGSSYYF